MKIGDVCLLTNDVPRFSAFYKPSLGVDNGSSDDSHRFIISQETALTLGRGEHELLRSGQKRGFPQRFSEKGRSSP